MGKIWRRLLPSDSDSGSEAAPKTKKVARETMGRREPEAPPVAIRSRPDADEAPIEHENKAAAKATKAAADLSRRRSHVSRWACPGCRHENDPSVPICALCWRGRDAQQTFRDVPIVADCVVAPKRRGPPPAPIDDLRGADRVARNLKMSDTATEVGKAVLEVEKKHKAEQKALRDKAAVDEAERTRLQAELEDLRRAATEHDELRRKTAALEEALEDKEELNGQLIISENKKMTEIDVLKSELASVKKASAGNHHGSSLGLASRL